MGRLYCMHMTPIDEHCDECPPAVDIWDAARAWQAFRDWLNFGDLDEADNMYGDEWETQS